MIENLKKYLLSSGVICTKILASLTDIDSYIRQIKKSCDLK